MSVIPHAFKFGKCLGAEQFMQESVTRALSMP